jgi:hypothetical protein
MSTNSKLIITFNRTALEGESVSFYRTKDDVLQSVKMETVFTNARTKKNELPVMANSGIDGEVEAVAFEKYFQIDYNPSGIMSVVRGLNVVTIEIEEGWSFDTFTSTAGATFEYIAAIPSPFYLVSAVVQESTSPCAKVKIRILTSQQASGYDFRETGIGTYTPVATNPFYVDVDRIMSTRIFVFKTGQPKIDVPLKAWREPHIYIRKVFEENIEIFISAHPLLGANVDLVVSYGSQLIERPPATQPHLEYSLDGVTWQTNPSFSGQVNGDYIAYVKDGYGCITQKPFTIKGVRDGRPSHLEISDLNSIGLAENQVWNGDQDGIEKNSENTLALSETQPFLYDEKIIFREKDLVRIQFKSNYDEHDVKIERCDSEQTMDINIDKMSNNLDLYEGLDAKMYSYGDGSLTAIFYTEGRVFDEADIQTGTFELNGNLPNSAKIGNLIEIVTSGIGVGGLYEVIDIIYDAEIDKNVMIFNYDCRVENPTDVITKAYYDIINYEIYEFNVDFQAIVNLFRGPISYNSLPLVRLMIGFSDSVYENRTFYSNWINIIKTNLDFDLNKYISIKYWADNNRSIFYLYGITHFIRAEAEFTNIIIDDESSLVKGDSSTYLSESIVNQGLNVKFAPVTYKIMIKLILATSSQYVVINGLSYVKNGNVEVEPVPNTNLYNLTCNFLRSNENFNTFVSGNIGRDEGYKTIYIPKLLKSSSDGYLKL